MTNPTDEVRPPDQRPVDPRRRNLKVIRAVDRVFNVERRGNVMGERLAILQRHAAVGALRHDLKRRAVVPRKAHPHQTVSVAGGDRLDDVRDPRLDAGFDYHPRLFRCRHPAPFSKAGLPTKKSGSGAPLSNDTSRLR